MSDPQTGRLQALRLQVMQALQAKDLARAGQLLHEPPGPGDPPLDQLAIGVYLAQRRWTQAAVVLARQDLANPHHRIRLNLVRNLAAIQQHRPVLYRTLESHVETGRHHVHRFPSGQLTIARRGPDGSNVFLSASGEPAQAARLALASIEQAWSQGRTLGLCGVGDGYFLHLLAQKPPALAYTRTQAVHLFEPDVDLLMHALMIHDHTGPQGAIEQSRFIWHVGPQWRKRYEACMNDQQPFLPHPALLAQLAGDDLEAQALIDQVQAAGVRQQQEIQRSLDAHYAQQLADGMLGQLLSPQPPRPVRVMVLTSRFTTVLQHEARRIAGALEAMGCQVGLVMEPDDHCQMQPLGIRKAVASFLPDIFFTLDHLRHEHAELMPAQLPYVCWVQDLLPNIVDAKAGASAGKDALQWVMSFCTPLLTGRYGYPADRCMDVPIMLASEPSLPASWESDGPDLAYVSNLSQTPSVMVERTLAAVAQVDRELMQACCQRIQSHYDAGLSLPSKTDIATLVGPVMRGHWSRHGLSAGFDEGQAIMHLVDRLWNPLNIGLYRQQALGWVADIARDMGLSLAIHGLGWEDNPRFAAYARGPITPGQPLQRLVRSVKINLNLEPYLCVTHVRLLDGLTSGGFHLIRHHPANTQLPELAAFLRQHAPDAMTDAQALAQAHSSLGPTLEKLLAANASVSYDHPPQVVAQLRCCQRAGVLPGDGGPLLPRLAEVSFDGPADCRRLVESFINQAGNRRQIMQEQRQAVLSRLTLRQGLARLLERIRQDMQTLSQARMEPQASSTDTQATTGT